jgi:hypothetical protein
MSHVGEPVGFTAATSQRSRAPAKMCERGAAAEGGSRPRPLTMTLDVYGHIFPRNDDHAELGQAFSVASAT